MKNQAIRKRLQGSEMLAPAGGRLKITSLGLVRDRRVDPPAEDVPSSYLPPNARLIPSAV